MDSRCLLYFSVANGNPPFNNSNSYIEFIFGASNFSDFFSRIDSVNEITQFDKELVEKIRRALYFSKIMSYAQGFEQLRVASENYNWNLNYGDMAKIWREGCIIRAQFLQKITDAYEKNPELKNLMLDDYFKKIVEEYQNDVRDIAALAIKAGVACPGFSSAITYYDQYRSAHLPANIIQAQRDYFGAHTYERTDREGVYHYEWYHEE